jgi:hypothetical protein
MTKRKYDHININGINVKGFVTFIEATASTAYTTGMDDEVYINHDRHAVMQIKIPLVYPKQEQKVCEIIQTRV